MRLLSSHRLGPFLGAIRRRYPLRWGWLLLASLVGSAGPAVGQRRHAAPAPFGFAGRYLVAVSDADMVASAYVDGHLGPAEGADALSVIRLGGPPRAMRAAHVAVTNSVAGPPASLAVTPDGRYAVVIETLGPRPAGPADPKLRDLALGRTLTVVDLTNPDRPRVTQRLTGPEYPLSVAINFDGSLVAVAYGPRGAGRQTPLALYRFSGGQLADFQTPAVPGWVAGDELTHVEFHPQENILGLVVSTHPRLVLMRLTGTGPALSLAPWGNAVDLEKAPYLVRFTPDGRYAVANAIYGEADVLDGGMGAPHGSVLSVRLAATTGPDGTPQHRLVSHAETGVLPEGLNVSPDGRWVVTANLERSAAAFDDPRQGFFSSLTLLHLDPETGRLETAGTFAFDGVLPETAVFDNSSRYLAVATFDHFDEQRAGGSVDFWRLATDYYDPRRVELIKTDYSVPVARGVHSLVIVR